MNNTQNTKKQAKKTFPATIAIVINDYRVVINRGTLHDVREGQRFLIYNLSEEEIRDPSTNEPLGKLEIVKGTGKVIHVQDQIATIESDRRERKIIRRKPVFSIGRDTEEEVLPGYLVPFDNPEVGDKVKPI